MAPGLTSIGAENCMGSWSIGATGGNGVMGAGLGFGKTVESIPCNRRANAKYLWIMAKEMQDGTLAAAAVLLLAQDDEVRAALTKAGVEGFKSIDGKITQDHKLVNPQAQSMDQHHGPMAHTEATF